MRINYAQHYHERVRSEVCRVYASNEIDRLPSDLLNLWIDGHHDVVRTKIAALTAAQKEFVRAKMRELTAV